MKSYKELDIYKEAFDLSILIRNMSLKLSYPDKFEVGSQIRRSSQSIKDNIAEGFGRKKYKAEFIRFLYFSYASTQESISQAEFIEKISKNSEWHEINDKLDFLAIKIFRFIQYVEHNWKT